MEQSGKSRPNEKTIKKGRTSLIYYVRDFFTCAAVLSIFGMSNAGWRSEARVKLLKGEKNMPLVRWDPFRDFNSLPSRFGDFFRKDWEAPLSTTAWNPSVDIFENDNEVVVKAELPGMDAKDIEVRLENNVLMLKGERRFEKETKEENYHRVEREYGTFSRAFALPRAVNGDKVTAEYKDGILKIVMPKKEETKPKPIKVAAA
jgi:HSP20 family protein